MAEEGLVGEVVAEAPILLRRHDKGRALERLQLLLLPLVDQDLSGGDGLEELVEPRPVDFGEGELARRGVDEGEADVVLVAALGAPADGGEVVGPLRVEEAVVEGDARRHHLDDAALDDLPGVLRIFELLADGHPQPGGDELGQVAVEGVVGEAGEGDVGGAPVRALRERDAEHAADGLGVLLEGLVEVAHAEEQDGAGVALLDLVVLPHERRLPGLFFCFGLAHDAGGWSLQAAGGEAVS